jgi:hypothetical protein
MSLAVEHGFKVQMRDSISLVARASKDFYIHQKPPESRHEKSFYKLVLQPLASSLLSSTKESIIH